MLTLIYLKAVTLNETTYTVGSMHWNM